MKESKGKEIIKKKKKKKEVKELPGNQPINYLFWQK